MQNGNVAPDNRVGIRKVQEICLKRSISPGKPEFPGPGNHRNLSNALKLLAVALQLQGASVLDLVGEHNRHQHVRIKPVQSWRHVDALQPSDRGRIRIRGFWWWGRPWRRRCGTGWMSIAYRLYRWPVWLWRLDRRRCLGGTWTSWFLWIALQGLQRLLQPKLELINRDLEVLERRFVPFCRWWQIEGQGVLWCLSGEFHELGLVLYNMQSNRTRELK